MPRESEMKRPLVAQTTRRRWVSAKSRRCTAYAPIVSPGTSSARSCASASWMRASSLRSVADVGRAARHARRRRRHARTLGLAAPTLLAPAALPLDHASTRRSAGPCRARGPGDPRRRSRRASWGRTVAWRGLRGVRGEVELGVRRRGQSAPCGIVGGREVARGSTRIAYFAAHARALRLSSASPP